jgi:hypothetical protein
MTKIMQGDKSTFSGNTAYATASAFQVWWAAELAKLKPKWRVFVVSPGAVMGTGFTRDLPRILQLVYLSFA